VGAEAFVSVVIPTHGRRSLLERTLASLVGQDYPSSSMEVVVVDDASPDDTPSFLEAFSPPWRLVTRRHAENLGRSAARNTGLEAASGDVVVFIDDDMRCVSDLVSRHVACLASHPNTVAVGTALSDPALGRSTVSSFYDGMGVHRLAPGSAIPARYFVTNNAAVPRAALDAAGGFDPAFSCYGFEDCELAFRMEDAGFAFRHCPGAVAYHMEAMTLEGFLARREEATRAIAAILAKHPHRARDIPASVLLPPDPADPASLRARKALLRVLTASPFCRLVRGAASAFWWRSLSVPVVTYLVACGYRRGLADGLRKRPRDTPNV